MQSFLTLCYLLHMHLSILCCAAWCYAMPLTPFHERVLRQFACRVDCAGLGCQVNKQSSLYIGLKFNTGRGMTMGVVAVVVIAAGVLKAEVRLFNAFLVVGLLLLVLRSLVIPGLLVCVVFVLVLAMLLVVIRDAFVDMLWLYCGACRTCLLTSQRGDQVLTQSLLITVCVLGACTVGNVCRGSFCCCTADNCRQ